jgi:transposase
MHREETMRVQKQRRYDAAFKAEAVALLDRTDRSVTQVAESLGMAPGTLYRWYDREMARRRDKPKLAAPGMPAPATETLQQKLARLQRENAALRKENDDLKLDKEILKKAAVYSTGHRNTTTSDSWLKKVVTHAGSEAGLVPRRKC